MKRKKTGEKPIYPHTAFVGELYDRMADRKLTETEARAVLNARILESIVEAWLPELREMLTEMKEGDADFENTQLLITQSCFMAEGISIELTVAKVELERIQVATTEQIKGLLRVVKSP